jgi:hypothetical protein
MNNKNIRPVPMGCLTDFPVLDETFDSMTTYEMIQKLAGKVNEVIHFTNDLLEDKLNEYINQKFNDMIINTMYIPETETLVLYLDQQEN